MADQEIDTDQALADLGITADRLTGPVRIGVMFADDDPDLGVDALRVHDAITGNTIGEVMLVGAGWMAWDGSQENGTCIAPIDAVNALIAAEATRRSAAR